MISDDEYLFMYNWPFTSSLEKCLSLIFFYKTFFLVGAEDFLIPFFCKGRSSIEIPGGNMAPVLSSLACLVAITL